MKIRKIKKRYKTMFLASSYCTKVKFKKIGTLIKTLSGVFVTYEVRKWFHKKRTDNSIREHKSCE